MLIKNGSEKTFAVSLLQYDDVILKILNPLLSQGIMSRADIQANTFIRELLILSCM